MLHSLSEVTLFVKTHSWEEEECHQVCDEMPGSDLNCSSVCCQTAFDSVTLRSGLDLKVHSRNLVCGYAAML